MDTNISNITVSDAAKWIFGGFAQNWIIWLLSLICGFAFAWVVFGALWVWGKHNIMDAKKKKYFYGGIALVSTLFIGATMILCSMMTSVARHLNQQVEDMRTAAVGRENRGIEAGVFLAANTPTPIYITNADWSSATSQGMSLTPENKITQSGANMIFVLRVSNSGPPTTLWNYKAYINLIGQDGKEHEVDASIPSQIIQTTNNIIMTLVGPITLTRDNFLLDALSFKALQTGDAGNYWLVIHVNGIPEIPPGTHVVITFTDIFGREIKIDHIWAPGT
jgi:hypothetical protein